MKEPPRKGGEKKTRRITKPLHDLLFAIESTSETRASSSKTSDHDLLQKAPVACIEDFEKKNPWIPLPTLLRFQFLRYSRQSICVPKRRTKEFGNKRPHLVDILEVGQETKRCSNNLNSEERILPSLVSVRHRLA